jgi:hypothetical protein
MGMSAIRPRQNSVTTCTGTGTALRARNRRAQPPAQQIGATLAATSCSWPSGRPGYAARAAPGARASWRSSDRAADTEGIVFQ